LRAGVGGKADTGTSGRPDRNGPPKGQYLWIKPLFQYAPGGAPISCGVALFAVSDVAPIAAIASTIARF